MKIKAQFFPEISSINLYDQKICSALSLWAYHDNDRPRIPNGYRFLFDSDKLGISETGFYAAAFLDEEYTRGAYPGIIVTFRGTKEGLDYYEAYRIAVGNVPTYLSNADAFMLRVKEHLNKNYPRRPYIVVLTGHSLGGVLAELIYAKEKKDHYGPYMMMTFDKPGTKPVIQKSINEGKLPKNAMQILSNTIHYAHIVSDVNVINTCHEHVGKQIYRAHIPYDLSIGVPAKPNELYFFLKFTIQDQHKILKIYQHYNKNKTMEKIESRDWPIDFDAAYKNHLTYKNRTEYWDKHMDQWWKQFPEGRERFENSIVKFKEFFIKEYLNPKIEKILTFQSAQKIYGDSKNIYPFFESKEKMQQNTIQPQSDVKRKDDDVSIKIDWNIEDITEIAEDVANEIINTSDEFIDKSCKLM